ncbi:MAG: cation transporter [Bacteroidales bacterium]|nr:cation transporter [Bacteroidales bacterium]
MEIYMDREKEIRNVTLWGSVVNLILTTIKIIAGFLGRSGAMVADGVHSFSDLLTDFVVIAFTRVSSKGHDRSHSFGHGKFETMATLVVGLVLIAVGANLMANGVESIVDAIKGDIIPRPRYIALIAAAISIISKEIMYHITVKVGKRTGSQAVIANAWHHRSDALSSIGSFFGIGGAILLGEKWTILDPIAGCCISIAIIVVAIKICIPSLAELLDASLPEDVENEIISNTLSVKGVNDVHGLKTRRSGISFIIVAHIVVNPTLSLVEAHDISTDVENALKRRFGDQTQISIHVEPDINAQ